MSEERVVLVEQARRYINPDATWVRGSTFIGMVFDCWREIKAGDLLVLRRGDFGRWYMNNDRN